MDTILLTTFHEFYIREMWYFDYILHDDISQILLLYKVRGYYNKFESMKSLWGILQIYQNATVRVCWAWIRIYVLYSKTFGSLFWILAGLRRAARGTRICETGLFWDQTNMQMYRNPRILGSENNWGMQYKMVFKICEGISGPCLNIKTVLSTYGDFHVKDKTAVRTSYL